MPRTPSFSTICAMAAACRLYNSGTPIKEIAKQSGKSESTIRRWLRIGGVK